MVAMAGMIILSEITGLDNRRRNGVKIIFEFFAKLIRYTGDINYSYARHLFI